MITGIDDSLPSEGTLASAPSVLLDQYRTMAVIRRFEEEAARAYAQGKIGGFLHLYIGQEAIAVGADAALDKGDYVFQTYRDHGIAIARGMSPNSAMAELFGKDPGCSRGLGGSMHFFDPDNGFYGGWGIVGGHIALAAGAAFKSKYSGDGRVTICFFGEGATNIGGFHEAMSLAGLWRLPAVFICENNQYAMGTPMSRTSPLSDLTLKAQGYGMAGDRFEGYDVGVVAERIGNAVKRARAGEGPTFIEIETYRFRGHSMSDPGKYRSREELEERKKKDPLLVIREHMKAAEVPEDAIDAIDEEVDTLIEEAVRFADEAEPAKEEVMRSTVYVGGSV
ncbi:MAG: pyruvate dehydrogenase (acetyl-transferring) E1 component subunit alpha [Polyangiaceae bacterium]|nr:pyruvate dehydrogenase (acetyl-transferring) E1 component subunit alpha [Polyangiaceae bacterium]